MKKIFALIIVLSVFFGVQGIAQNTADSKISNKSTFQGKRQLKKEMRIHQNASNVTASNERKAKKKNAKGGLPKGTRKPIKKDKNKEKSKSVVIEEKKLATTEPKKD